MYYFTINQKVRLVGTLRREFETLDSVNFVN